MPATVVSPMATVNRPFVTGTEITVAGILFSSWLHNVVSGRPGFTRMNLNCPVPVKLVPFDVTRP